VREALQAGRGIISTAKTHGVGVSAVPRVKASHEGGWPDPPKSPALASSAFAPLDGGSTEQDVWPDSAGQVVSQERDSAPRGPVRTQWVHPIRCRVSERGDVPLQEPATEETIRAERAIGGVLAERDQASHIAEMELSQRFMLLEVSDEAAREENCLLSSDLRRRRERLPIRSREDRAIAKSEHVLVRLAL